jgi:hypothetical protein
MTMMMMNTTMASRTQTYYRKVTIITSKMRTVWAQTTSKMIQGLNLYNNSMRRVILMIYLLMLPHQTAAREMINRRMTINLMKTT